MVYNEEIDLLITEINNLNNIFSQDQSAIFLELDSLKILQNNIKTLSTNLKTSTFIENEISILQDLVLPPRIVILGNNPLTIEVFTDLSSVELGAIAYDYSHNIIDVVIEYNIDISNVGTYSINYYAIDSYNNDISATRIVNVIDSTPPILSLIGENPIIWNINTPYVDPGINIVDNYDPSLNVVINDLVNVNNTGIYSYIYIVRDDYNNTTQLTRVVYILDYTILDNIPIINISEDSSNNIVNILKFVENTVFFPNNELAKSDDFNIHFEQRNLNYNIPLELLKNSFTNYYKMNNMIIFVYGFDNERIHIMDNSNNVSFEYPYITNNLDVKNLVNLFINNNEKYKLLILNGKHSNLLDNRKPVLNLLGNNPYNLQIDTSFSDPGFIAYDYNNNDISVNTYDNIDTSILGRYNKLYVATDISGNQNIKNRIIDVIDISNIEIS